MDEIGDGGVAAEIARWPPHRERTRAGPGDFEPWGDVVECSDDRLEQSSFTGLVTFVKDKRGAPTLGGTAPHPRATPWARAPGEAATMRLAYTTATGSARSTPVATTGQSGHQATRVRTGALRGECGYRPAGPRHEDFELTGARRRSSTAALDVEAP